MIKLFFLGRPYVEVNGQEVHLRRRKNLALLAYLALADEPRRREELSTLLWPELDTYHAQTALRRDLWVLKNTIKSVDLISTRDSVELSKDAPHWCDVSAFQQLLAHTHRRPHEAAEQESAEIATLLAAVQLYRDDFLWGFSLTDSPTFDEWQVNQGEALRHQLITALSRLVTIYVASKQTELAITYTQRLIEIDAFHEPAHYQLMELYAEAGRYGAALQQFERYTRLMSEELGLPPSVEMRARQATIQEQLSQSFGLIVHAVEGDDSSGDDFSAIAHDGVHRSTNGREMQRPAPTPPLKLPTPTTPFVGRVRETSSLIERLLSPECRLLTVLGPGGMGKSRLAIAVAAQVHKRYPDGIFFVNLAPLRHAQFLAAAILETLGTHRETDRTPEETLIAHLQKRHMLLILDNYEHLLEGTPFLQRVLAVTDRVQFLITSRTRLNIPLEWLFPLDGMAYGETQANTGSVARRTPGSVEDLDAIQLFHQCAERVQPAITWTAQEATAVTEICRLVEGIPLAIELAATWLPVMAATAIASNLRHNLDLLTTTEEGIPERQRSIRSTLEYSWQLAGPAEQMILARLAVFNGGFLPPIAQAVTDADPAMLRALTDKSWLHRTISGRVEMHELVHQFCAEKLETGAHEAARVHNRHADYYANFAQARASELCDHRQVDAVQAIADELDNIRVAWAYAQATGNIHVLHDLLDGFYGAGLIRSWHQEMVDLFSATLATVGAAVQPMPPRNIAPPTDNAAPTKASTAGQSTQPLVWLCARLHTRLAHVLADLGQFDEANNHCSASLSLLDGDQPAAVRADTWTEIQWRQERALANAVQCQVLHTLGLVDAALARAMDTRSQLTDLPAGLLFDVSSLLITRMEAITRFAVNERQTAQRLLIENAARLRRRGERWLRSQFLDTLIFQLRVGDEIALSQHYATEWLALCRDLGDQRGVALCLLTLGYNAIFCDSPDLPMAQRYFDEMADVSDRLGHPLVSINLCEGLAQLAYFKGEWAAARRHLAQAQAIAQAGKNEQDSKFVHIWFGEVALAEGKLDEAQRHFGILLTSATAHNVMAEILLGLEGMAKVCVYRQEFAEATPILQFIYEHPNTWEFARKRVSRLIEELQAEHYNSNEIKPQAADAALSYTEAMAWAQARLTQETTGKKLER